MILSPVLLINIIHWGSQSLAGWVLRVVNFSLSSSLCTSLHVWLTCIPATLGLPSIMARWKLNTICSSILFKFQNRISQVVTGYPEAWLLPSLYSCDFKHLSFYASHCGIKYHKICPLTPILITHQSLLSWLIIFCYQELTSIPYVHMKTRRDLTDLKCFKIL